LRSLERPTKTKKVTANIDANIFLEVKMVKYRAIPALIIE